jgi:hypothetical protein
VDATRTSIVTVVDGTETTVRPIAGLRTLVSGCQSAGKWFVYGVGENGVRGLFVLDSPQGDSFDASLWKRVDIGAAYAGCLPNRIALSQSKAPFATMLFTSDGAGEDRLVPASASLTPVSSLHAFPGASRHDLWIQTILDLRSDRRVIFVQDGPRQRIVEFASPITILQFVPGTQRLVALRSTEQLELVQYEVTSVPRLRRSN